MDDFHVLRNATPRQGGMFSKNRSMKRTGTAHLTTEQGDYKGKERGQLRGTDIQNALRGGVQAKDLIERKSKFFRWYGIDQKAVLLRDGWFSNFNSLWGTKTGSLIEVIF